MRGPTIAICLLACLPLIHSAGAMNPCHEPVTSIAGQAYLIPRVADAEWLLLVRSYLESNGVDGLQRGGIDLWGEPDPCQQSLDPDTMVWYGWCYVGIGSIGFDGDLRPSYQPTDDVWVCEPVADNPIYDGN